MTRGGVAKDMACVDCPARTLATIAMAKANGWEVWVGGARCRACVTGQRRLDAERARRGQGGGR